MSLHQPRPVNHDHAHHDGRRRYETQRSSRGRAARGPPEVGPLPQHAGGERRRARGACGIRSGLAAAVPDHGRQGRRARPGHLRRRSAGRRARSVRAGAPAERMGGHPGRRAPQAGHDRPLRPPLQRRAAGPPARRRGDAHRPSLRPQQRRHPGTRTQQGPARVGAARRRRGRPRAVADVRGPVLPAARHHADGPGMRGQWPQPVRSAGRRHPVDPRRGRLRRVDGRAPARCPGVGRRQGRRRVRGLPWRRRPARRRGALLTRHPHRQGDGRARPDRVRDQRRAAAGRARLPGAAPGPRLDRQLHAEVAQPDPDPGPRARLGEDERLLLPGAGVSGGAGGQAAGRGDADRHLLDRQIARHPAAREPPDPRR